MTLDEITFEAEERMEKAATFLRQEFRTIRAGRASPAILDTIKVDYYGAATALKSLANISAPEANLIIIKPFDTACVKDIEKAIQASPLGLTPNSDGRIIRLAVPPLSGERRQQLAQQIKQMAELARVGIRNARRDANKHLEQAQKNKELTEDERDKGKKDIDELTQKYVHQVDETLEAKTNEILEV